MNLPSIIHTMAPGLRAPVTPAAFWRPAYLEPSPRLEHVPFAFWLVDALRPRVAVQCGTADATTYFAICQAVERLGLETDCFVLEGIPPRAQDDLKRAERARNYHDVHYRTFSSWLPRTLERTSVRFSSDSVDLLHLSDSLSYEELTRILEEWRPKMSEQAVLLIDNTRAMAPNAAAPRLYRELRTEFAGFELPFGEGLGLVAIGSRPHDRMDRFLRTCETEPDRRTLIEAFGRLGRACVDALEARTQEARANSSLAELRTYKIEVEELKTLGERAQRELRQKSDELLQIQQQVAAMAEQHALERGSLAERISFLHELRDETKGVFDRLLSDLKGKSDELLQTKVALSNREQNVPLIDALQAKLTARDADFAQLHEQLEAGRTQSNGRISELQSSLEEQQLSQARTQHRLDESETALNDVKDKLKAEGALRQHAEHVLSQTNARLREQENLVAQLRANLEEHDAAKPAQAELAERFKRMESELAAARTSLLGMQELQSQVGQLAGVQADFDAARTKIATLDAERDRDRRQLDSQLADLARVQADLDTAQGEIASLVAQREGDGQQIELQRAMLTDVQSELDVARSEIESLVAKRSDDDHELDLRATELSAIRDAVSALESELGQRNELLAAMERAALARDEEFSQAQGAVAVISGKLSLCQDERDAATAAMDNAARELDEVRDAFADSRETIAELSEALESAGGESERVKVLHREQMERANAELSSMRQVVVEKSNALGQARRALEEERAQLQSARASIDSFEAARADWARTMDERFQEIAALTEANLRLQETAARVIALGQDVSRLSGEKQGLAAELASMDAALKSARGDAEARTTHIGELQEELTDRFSEVADLTRALQDGRRTLLELRSDLDQKAVALEAQAREAEQATARSSQLLAELERVQRSASWRLTMPLRVFDRSSRKGAPPRFNRRAVEESSLFDPKWYRERYPDVAEYTGDLLDHYLHIGWKEGKDPGPGFNGLSYLRENPAAERSGLDPLTHFLQFGRSRSAASKHE
jgi:chromosome segregation ATPase